MLCCLRRVKVRRWRSEMVVGAAGGDIGEAMEEVDLYIGRIGS